MLFFLFFALRIEVEILFEERKNIATQSLAEGNAQIIIVKPDPQGNAINILSNILIILLWLYLL